MHRAKTLLALSAIFAAPILVSAGERPQLPKTFTLGRYVPQDAFFFVHEVYNPERDFICKHWDRVLTALGECGLDIEIKNLITSKLDDQKRASFEAGWNKVWTAIRAVSWSELGKREFVFAERLHFPIPNYIFLTRNDPQKVEALASSLKALLEAVASFSEKAQVVQSENAGATIWTLKIEGFPLPSVLGLFRRGDIIGLSVGKDGTGEILALMSGRSEKKSIVDSPRFQQALASIENPEDLVTFFQLELLLDQVKGFMATAMGHASDKEEVAVFKSVAFKVIDELAIVDYVISTRRTDGLREECFNVAKLRSSYRDMVLGKALTERKQFDKFDRFVPAGATGFSINTFIDLGTIYNAVLDFLRTEVPEGPDLIAKWDALQEEIGFNPNRDVFSWLSGEIISVTLPGSMPGRSQGVAMIRTKNPELASEKVNAAIDALASKLGEHIMVAPVPEIEAGGFRSMFHPMMMMLQIKPVIGMHEEWLVIGTTPDSVKQCLAAAAGKSPSFRTNKRYLREGLSIDGKVCSASFADRSTLGQELAMACAMCGMWSALIPENEGTRPIKAIFGMMGRLSPVLAEIDFFSSTSSVCTFSDGMWRGRSVTTYKPLPAKTIEVEKAVPGPAFGANDAE